MLGLGAKLPFNHRPVEKVQKILRAGEGFAARLRRRSRCSDLLPPHGRTVRRSIATRYVPPNNELACYKVA
jgi:hypothetical protein